MEYIGNEMVQDFISIQVTRVCVVQNEALHMVQVSRHHFSARLQMGAPFHFEVNDCVGVIIHIG